MLSQDELRAIEERWNKATPGPWSWGSIAREPQLEGNVDYDEMNPILVARGCGNDNDKGSEVRGCMPGKYEDPLWACPLHPSAADRDFIAHSHDDIKRLLAHSKALVAADAAIQEAERVEANNL